MPLAVTVLESIALELKRRLDLMVDNDDYQTKVVEVIRPTRLDGYTPQDLQIVLTFGQSQEVPELMCPGNPPASAKRQIFNIRCHVMTDEQDTTAVDSTINLFASEVVVAVCDPANSWHTFDGNSFDAEWLDRENINADGGVDGINLPLAITYRTDEGNPFNLRA